MKKDKKAPSRSKQITGGRLQRWEQPISENWLSQCLNTKGWAGSTGPHTRQKDIPQISLYQEGEEIPKQTSMFGLQILSFLPEQKERLLQDVFGNGLIFSEHDICMICFGTCAWCKLQKSHEDRRKKVKECQTTANPLKSGGVSSLIYNSRLSMLLALLG